jgi:ABC-type nitrate/sulfonate/bicarbonate transport system substrate-binding protein
MPSAGSSRSSFARTLVVGYLFLAAQAHAAGPLLVAYGGHNETTAAWWVGTEKGLFRKHGVDPQTRQVRSSRIIMTTLATGGAPVVWPSPSSMVSAAVGGLKIVRLVSMARLFLQDPTIKCTLRPTRLRCARNGAPKHSSGDRSGFARQHRKKLSLVDVVLNDFNPR